VLKLESPVVTFNNLVQLIYPSTTLLNNRKYCGDESLTESTY
jgi:hypothetical protein